jgi:type I restriction enzyme M protein
MIGAIIGDIVGSRFEWKNIKTKSFKLFVKGCVPTDDTIMTIALAKAILDCNSDYNHLSENSVECMQEIGRSYPNCGFGGNCHRRDIIEA